MMRQNILVLKPNLSEGVPSTTLLLNEGIPRALKGKKLRLKNILKFPSKSEGIITCVPAEGNALIF